MGVEVGLASVAEPPGSQWIRQDASLPLPAGEVSGLLVRSERVREIMPALPE
ncbi:hypothetical protein [Nocardia sp. NPDC049707]|uniref:hypothetical protein n=1 Tax=Nocardia sp. NPDC049707 TaxID=3154735 RepID=UPI00343283E0